MIEAFELLLCYWAWLKKDEFWEINDIDALQCAKTSIFKTINQLKHLFPRSTGNQWKIPKLHEQMHIAHNIYLFGNHQNIHTGPQEHNHIAISKKPSQHTQKRKKNFDSQLGNRLIDQYSIDFTQNKILKQQSINDYSNEAAPKFKDISLKHTNMASKFEVSMRLEYETNKIDVQYQWITASKKAMN